jgi:glycosyltransferase involved in cell wall biosynthesis
MRFENPRLRRPRVLIVYRTIPQYRRAFYELLRERLAAEGVELGLIYGQPTGSEESKRDHIDLPWAVKRRNRVLRLGAHDVYWQPCVDAALRADLVIVEQASRLLVNHVLFALALAGRTRLAFWGNGRKLFVHARSSIGEAAKGFETRHAHWFFAYTESTAAIVRGLGLPEARITTVQNAIDTATLRGLRGSLDLRAPGELRERLGIRGDQVCLFAGAMYREKRIAFLLEACRLVRERIPGFEVVFLGAGPDHRLVAKAARENTWVHCVGPVFDEEKVPYFALAKLLLMPGGVGLGILDSFALGVPLVAMAGFDHGPEVEYLEDGVNGLIVHGAADARGYADAVAALLLEPSRIEGLRQGCDKACGRYTVEEMVERFAAGTLEALRSGGVRLT